MKIVIAGGSGQVGTVLARALHAKGHEIVVLSRRAGLLPWRAVAWGRKEPRRVVRRTRRRRGDRQSRRPQRQLPLQRAANRREIMASRVDSTRCIGNAIAACARPPRVWLQASTATIYSHRYDAPNDEADGHTWRRGTRRSRRLAIQYRRRHGMGANCKRGRRRRQHGWCLMRSAMTMSPDRRRHLRHLARAGAARGSAAVAATDGNLSLGFTSATSCVPSNG